MNRRWIVLVLVASLVRLPEKFVVVIPLLLITKDDTGVPIVVVVATKVIRNDVDDIFICVFTRWKESEFCVCFFYVILVEVFENVASCLGKRSTVLQVY